MPILRKLSTFRAQPSAVRRRVPAAWASLVVVSSSLRLLGFARTHDWLNRTSRRGTAPGTGAAGRDLAHPEAAAVTLVARNVPVRAWCLEKALTLWWLLRRRGIDAALRIGVRRAAEGPRNLEAHAWVEVGGEVLGDTDDVGARYAAFEGDVGVLARAIRAGEGGWRLGDRRAGG